MRIAFTLNEDAADWSAGIQYYLNLFVALHAADSDQLQLVLAVNPAVNPASYEHLKPYIHEAFNFSTETFWHKLWRQEAFQKLERLTRLHLIPEPVASKMLCRRQVDAVFSWFDFGPSFRLPLITWVPDFQYAHLPEMFPASSLAARQRAVHQRLERGNLVIVSSRDSMNDLARFFPQFAPKGRVLPFVAQVPPGVYAQDPSLVCRQYHLPEKFFFLPNQFWKHKNHEIVLQALQLIQKSNPDITVVCTGNTNDVRNPQYFPRLLTKISAWGLRENFILLGMVPYEHVSLLIRQSIAILQPSIFEGWSTIVEEAKSIGKSILLSDIAVHREQNPPGGRYFAPKDPQALAEAMLEWHEQKQPGPDAALEKQAQEMLPQRTKKFGLDFLAAAHEVIEMVGKQP